MKLICSVCGKVFKAIEHGMDFWKHFCSDTCRELYENKFILKVMIPPTDSNGACANGYENGNVCPLRRRSGCSYNLHVSLNVEHYRIRVIPGPDCPRYQEDRKGVDE